MDTYLAFVLASFIILVVPGPTIILVVTQAVSHGRQSVVPLVAGVLLGDFCAMSLSLLGLGAVLSTSAALFSLFKWIGAFYLLYLGIKMWRVPSARRQEGKSPQTASPVALFKSSFIVTALNPKSIAFFVAFLPQFIHAESPSLPQLFTLGSTFLILATINAALYAFFAGQLSTFMKKSTVQRWFNRSGGTALIGAGLLTAGMHQSG